ncbi:unnamed protein product [Hymenolepis diminuta]|uniref:Lipopolysaccharide choline phosphotransferase n=1 Tax=Hymenolepis diminuta TaxID=6216 RepID=A0A0R3SZ44_HYMDI|nr:unnamed protein product [Hymenolepis diminuta]
MAVKKKTTFFLLGLVGLCLFGVNYLQIRQKKGKLPTTQNTEGLELFNLSSIKWPNLPRPNVSSPEEVAKLGALDVKTSVGQQRTLEILLEEFKKAMTRANLNGRWFLQAGALLGSIQHHDLIPWDDDADLHLHVRYRPAVQAALKQLTPKLHTYPLDKMDKLYFPPFKPNAIVTPTTVGSHKELHYPWGWPSIDIAYYHEVGPELCQDYLVPSRVFNISDVFPLTYRPLGKQWFPTPRRPISYLKSYYNTTKQTCISHWWSHAKEESIQPVIEDCRKLMEKYPFVSRCFIPGPEFLANSSSLCDEYLVNGKGEIIHKIRLHLDYDECESPLYTVRHESFECPL